MKTTKKGLLQYFHTLAAKSGLKLDEKRAIVESYGHTSSKDMSEDDLTAAIEKLKPIAARENAKADLWRKRVMAAVGGWLTRCKTESNAPKIKAIACRATGYRDFNLIPVARLRNVYNEFRNKQDDTERSVMVKADEIARLQNWN